MGERSDRERPRVVHGFRSGLAFFGLVRGSDEADPEPRRADVLFTIAAVILIGARGYDVRGAMWLVAWVALTVPALAVDLARPGAVSRWERAHPRLDLVPAFALVTLCLLALSGRWSVTAVAIGSASLLVVAQLLSVLWRRHTSRSREAR